MKQMIVLSTLKQKTALLLGCSMAFISSNVFATCAQQGNTTQSTNLTVLGNINAGCKLTSASDLIVNTNKLTVNGSTGDMNCAGSLTLTGTMGVTGLSTLSGGATILGSAGSNAATIGNGSDLRTTGSTHMLGKLDVNQTKFTVDGSGNVSAAGTLAVTGASTLTGNTSVGGTLGATGLSTLSGGAKVLGSAGSNALTVGNGADLRTTGSTHMLGELDINQSNFTVDGSGNVSAAGTLAVTGASTLTGNTAVGGTLSSAGDFSVNTNAITVSSALGIVTSGGPLRSNGDISLVNNHFYVHASNGNTIIDGTLTTGGNAVFSGTTQANQTLNSNGDFTVGNPTKCTITASSGNITSSGTLNVTHGATLGDSTVNGSLTVNNSATLNNGLTITGGDLVVTTNLSVQDTTTLQDELDITGTFTTGNWHNIFNEKSINSIGTTPTNIISMSFANLAGTTAPLSKGAFVTIRCVVSGTILGVNSINVYEGELFVQPGATSGANVTNTVISESTTNITGSGNTISSGVTGTGTDATLTLTGLLAMSSQSVAIFFEVKSDNLYSAV
jgi:hypothetical protein